MDTFRAKICSAFCPAREKKLLIDLLIGTSVKCATRGCQQKGFQMKHIPFSCKEKSSTPTPITHPPPFHRGISKCGAVEAVVFKQKETNVSGLTDWHVSQYQRRRCILTVCTNCLIFKVIPTILV